jgi:hypothetical protein
MSKYGEVDFNNILVMVFPGPILIVYMGTNNMINNVYNFKI